MPIPDYQTLMRPDLDHAAKSEVCIGALTETLCNELGLTPEERNEMLPSSKQLSSPTAFIGRKHTSIRRVSWRQRDVLISSKPVEERLWPIRIPASTTHF
jgi:restriction endonuclease Mrr